LRVLIKFINDALHAIVKARFCKECKIKQKKEKAGKKAFVIISNYVVTLELRKASF
jgi:hypothetical protein